MMMKNMLPVHCCCEPERRLGWAPVEHPNRLTVRYIVRQPSRPMWPDGRSGVAVQVLDVEVADLDLTPRKRETYVCREGRVHQTVPVFLRVRALKNADHPLALWEKVPGFIVDPRARSWSAAKQRAARSSAAASSSGSLARGNDRR